MIIDFLQLDTKFKSSGTGVSCISHEGCRVADAELKKLVGDQNWWLIFREVIGFETVSVKKPYQGKWWGRLAQYIKWNCNYTIDPDQIHKWVEKHIVANNQLTFDFHKHIDWTKGDYADPNSCLWSAYDAQRKWMNARDFYAIRTYNEKGVGASRALITCEQDNMVCMFNSYGAPLAEHAELMKNWFEERGRPLEVRYIRDFELWNRFEDAGVHPNMREAFAFADKVPAGFTRFIVGVVPKTCSRCSTPFDMMNHYNWLVSKSKDTVMCPTCKMEYICKSCGDLMEKKSKHKSLCDKCYANYYRECEICHKEVQKMHMALYRYERHIVNACEDCRGENAVWCQTCGCFFEGKVYFDAHTGTSFCTQHKDHLQYCRKCRHWTSAHRRVPDNEEVYCVNCTSQCLKCGNRYLKAQRGCKCRQQQPVAP